MQFSNYLMQFAHKGGVCTIVSSALQIDMVTYQDLICCIVCTLVA